MAGCPQILAALSLEGMSSEAFLRILQLLLKEDPGYILTGGKTIQLGHHLQVCSATRQ